MKKILILSAVFWSSVASSQDLNWNTSGYTTGNLTHNFGIIGSPASAVNMAITGSTGLINAGFPVLYAANWPGAGSCAVNCALRTQVTFSNIAQTLTYTFTFASPVSGLTFTVYDIDGNGSGTTIDQVTVNATNGVIPQNITMTDIDGLTTVVGSGGTNPVATAIFAGSTDNRVDVAIGGFVSSLAIIYGSGPTTTAFGAKSFSIGNMDWTAVLPVRWISFSGRMQTNGAVDLNWVTETEVNASHYEVEKSKDGQNFTAIGQLTARGGNRNTYLFTDNNPGPGNSFYRIRQVDIGGRFEFSNIVLIRPGKNNGSGFTITPNPASQHILVSSAANVQISRLQIYDVAGRLIYESKNGMNRVDISSFRPGLYNVKIENKSGDIFTESFIKK